MGAMKEVFADVQTALENRNWQDALDTLDAWGDDAPAQLWGALQLMADNQTAPAWDVSEFVPDRYLDHLTEINAHTLRALIEYIEGRPTGHTEDELEDAYQSARRTLAGGR